MSRIFLDANVLFTVLYNPDGLAANLLKHHKALSISCISSQYAWRECESNLLYKKPAALKNKNIILNAVSLNDIAIQEAFNPLKLPQEDLPIFQGALFTKCSHLLTGDLNHFGKWMNSPQKTFGLIIQTVRQFVDSRDSK